MIHRAHQPKALSIEEEAAGFTLTCCAAPQTDLVIEARTVVGAGEFPPRKMPSRITSIERPAPDVALIRLQLPANELFRYRAGQYVEFILRDGSRRSYSIANAPHTQVGSPGIELHIRHMPVSPARSNASHPGRLRWLALRVSRVRNTHHAV